MLPRRHRITLGADFRVVQRRGKRVRTRYFAVSFVKTGVMNPARVGIVVSKKVGGSVVRNRIRRQLRHVLAGYLRRNPVGVDVVIRVLPEAAHARSGELERAWSDHVDSVLAV